MSIRVSGSVGFHVSASFVLRYECVTFFLKSLTMKESPQGWQILVLYSFVRTTGVWARSSSLIAMSISTCMGQSLLRSSCLLVSASLIDIHSFPGGPIGSSGFSGGSSIVSAFSRGSCSRENNQMHSRLVLRIIVISTLF